ncbi:MAG: SpoIIE family protein phosphatase [Anaerolineae bacterium]|nr:SpoIIE family protein phosphatase [Anaerolineae bacterium]
MRCSRLGGVSGDRAGLVVHASAPLRAGERVLGILNVAAHDWREFTPRALALLENVGQYMGLTLERARLYDLLHERRIEEQDALLDLSNRLLARRDLSSIIDYVVEEARQLLNVDACALLVPVDDDPAMLYFRAASGWRGDPIAEGRLIPNDVRSGPGRVMQTRQALVIGDLEQDPSAAPWMADWLRREDFRGHAVVPLLVDGRPIGTLVVNSRRERRLDASELRFMRLLANQIALAIETVRLYQEDLKLQRMEEELAISQQIQLSMLPEHAPQIDGWQFVAKYKAARLVGGDFYDFFPLRSAPHKLGIIVADVADKGVPAALFMALSRTVIRITASEHLNPAAALQRVNDIIYEDNRTDVFLTACYAILDTHSGQVTLSNGGHNRPYCYRAASRSFEAITLPGIILGVLPDIELTETDLMLAPEDILILYTDGVTEAQDATGEQFGIEQLLAVIAEYATASAQEIMQGVIHAVNRFTDHVPLYDDFTLVLIKRT